jgi:hypothetical protein
MSNQLMLQMERKDGKVRPKQKMCLLEWMICIYIVGIIVGAPLAFNVYLLIAHEWFDAFMMGFVTIGAIVFLYNECMREKREKRDE